MAGLSSVDIHFLAKELQALKDGRINKIYQKKNKFTFKIHTKQGDFFLNVAFPNYVFISQKIKYSTEKPSNLCMGLRKHLPNAKILDIHQYKSERILELEFKGGLKFIIELFNKGNLILTKDNKIVALYSTQKLKDRTIAYNSEYIYPKERCDFIHKEQDFVKKMLDSEKNSVLALATEIGLGGSYAEEVCLLAGIDKDSEAKSNAEKAYKALKQLLNKEPEPNISGSTVYALDLNTIKNKEYFPTISSAIEHLILSEPERNPKLERIKHILKMQEENIRKIKNAIEENTKKGELIYENYALIREILETIKLKGIENAIKKYKNIKKAGPNQIVLDLSAL